MPLPLDHDEWVKAKADKTAAFKKHKKAAKKPGAKPAPPAKKVKADGKDLKLALANKFTSTMVTHCHMGQAEVKNMFDSIYKDASMETQVN
jgi:hypothetical protein